MTDKLYEILLDGKVAWYKINEAQLSKILYDITHNDHWKGQKVTSRLMKECPTCHSRLSGEDKID